MLHKVVLTSEFLEEILKCDDDHREAIEQYFPVVLFFTLYTVDEILKCDQSNESY